MSSVTGNNIAIEVAGLTKHYGAVLAADNISFTVKTGELFGFLGLNGAGKTTMINILTGLARADTGSLRIAGIDIGKNRKKAQHLIGVVPDENNLYPELTGFENLCFCGSLYGMSGRDRENRAGELLAEFGLANVARRKYATYSKGMKRKLNIAAGIIHRPQVLFLDEPTTGIDVASARQLRQMIIDTHRKGTTVFLTTHYIEEAERLCQRIAFIVGGELVRTDTLENLLKPVQGKYVLILSVSDIDTGLIPALESAFPHYEFACSGPGRVSVESAQPVSTGGLIRMLEDRGVEVYEARRHNPSLEDVFVSVTGIAADLIRKEKEKGGASP